MQTFETSASFKISQKAWRTALYLNQKKKNKSRRTFQPLHHRLILFFTYRLAQRNTHFDVMKLWTFRLFCLLQEYVCNSMVSALFSFHFHMINKSGFRSSWEKNPPSHLLQISIKDDKKTSHAKLISHFWKERFRQIFHLT